MEVKKNHLFGYRKFIVILTGLAPIHELSVFRFR